MSGILTGLFEKRFHVSEEPPGWVDRMFGSRTNAGVSVNETSALQMIAVFACIRILAETLASLPLITYRRLKDGGKERAQDYYLYPILHDMANPEMTAYQFRETIMGHAVSWGNGYAQIVLNQAGQVMEMWPLRPDRMVVERTNGLLQYTYYPGLDDLYITKKRVFRDGEIFHLPGLGFDGVTGYSTISMARQAIGLGLAAEEFGARFFDNDARPGFVLQHPGGLSDTAYKHIRESFEDEHKGVHRSHKPHVLEEGMTLKEVGIPPEDAQFLQTRKFQVEEIARLFRIPPHMLANLERATYSNIEQESLNFTIHTVRPWMVRWEQCIYKYLMTPAERKKYFAEHLVDGLLRGDIASRYAAYHIARQDGWMNADEIREKENMNPQPDGQGQVFLIPLNMTPAESAPATTGAQGGTQGRVAAAAGALRGLYLDASGRILRREKNDVTAAAKKYLQKREFERFGAWLGEFYKEHLEFIQRQLEPVAESQAELFYPGRANNKENVRYILEIYAKSHIFSSLESIKSITNRAILDEKYDPYAAIDELFDTWLDGRAREIAEQESVNFGEAIMKSVE